MTAVVDSFFFFSAIVDGSNLSSVMTPNVTSTDSCGLLTTGRLVRGSYGRVSAQDKNWISPCQGQPYLDAGDTIRRCSGYVIISEKQSCFQV